MKYFELSSFGTNKLVHLLSDFWIYQKYPSPFDVQDSYFNMGGCREGWRFVCVCVRVYLYVVQHAPTLFVFEFCNLKLDFRYNLDYVKKSKYLDEIVHFFPCDQCHQNGVSSLCTPVQPGGSWAGQSWEGLPYLLTVLKLEVALKDLLCVTVWKIP